MLMVKCRCLYVAFVWLLISSLFFPSLIWSVGGLSTHSGSGFPLASHVMEKLSSKGKAMIELGDWAVMVGSCSTGQQTDKQAWKWETQHGHPHRELFQNDLTWTTAAVPNLFSLWPTLKKLWNCDFAFWLFQTYWRLNLFVLRRGKNPFLTAHIRLVAIWRVLIYRLGTTALFCLSQYESTGRTSWKTFSIDNGNSGNVCQTFTALVWKDESFGWAFGQNHGWL